MAPKKEHPTTHSTVAKHLRLKMQFPWRFRFTGFGKRWARCIVIGETLLATEGGRSGTLGSEECVLQGHRVVSVMPGLGSGEWNRPRAVVDHDPDAFNLPGIPHCGGSLMFVHNVSRESDNAVGPRHLKPSHHQLMIGAHPVLYFRHDLCVVPPAGAARCSGYDCTMIKTPTNANTTLCARSIDTPQIELDADWPPAIEPLKLWSQTRDQRLFVRLVKRISSLRY